MWLRPEATNDPVPLRSLNGALQLWAEDSGQHCWRETMLRLTGRPGDIVPTFSSPDRVALTPPEVVLGATEQKPGISQSPKGKPRSSISFQPEHERLWRRGRRPYSVLRICRGWDRNRNAT